MALLTGVLFVSFGCQRKPYVAEARPFSRDRATGKRELEEVELNKAQSEAALKGEVLSWPSSASVGYVTASPNVLVAQRQHGAGFTYVSWVVIVRLEGDSWQIFGKPTEPIRLDTAERETKVRVTERGGDRVFEVERLLSPKALRLDLPD